MTAEAVALKAPEVRTYAAPALRLVVEDVEANGRLTELHGRAVPYNVRTNVGWYDETIRPGAFRKSIAEGARGLPLLLWHNAQAFPVGVAKGWDDNDDGLDGTWLLDDSDMAQNAGRQARDGFLTGLSIGFGPTANGSKWTFVDDDEWSPENGIVDHVERVEARLLETSLTPVPAYAGAAVSLVRSLDATRQVRRRRPALHRSAEVDRWRETLDGLRLT